MNLEALIRDQNPHWLDDRFFYPEKTFYYRSNYKDIKNAITSDLIITLTGLRRVGKSTLMKQILCNLLVNHPHKNIFYFSFDESIVKRDSEVLRRIIETYAVFILRRPFNTIAQKIYIFLDEVQIIPYWQDIIKTYSDLNKNLQFIVSGSSSLFISRKSTESLAGRVKEIVVAPLSFIEYIDLHKKTNEVVEKMGLSKYGDFFPEYLLSYFEKYLAVGQFPQPVEKNYDDSAIKEYIQTIESKIIEIDLPKIFPIKRPDILKIIFTYFTNMSGALLSYDNLTNDLGVDVRTTIKYIDWLKKAFLIDICFNHTKKLTKSSRTSKKIYLASTNFSNNLSLGNQVETYIFNFLKNITPHVEFFQTKNQEIDFIVSAKSGEKIPFEVKYQNDIKDSDEKAMAAFIKYHHPSYAFLITKNQNHPPRRINNTQLYYISAPRIESVRGSLMEKIF